MLNDALFPSVDILVGGQYHTDVNLNILMSQNLNTLAYPVTLILGDVHYTDDVLPSPLLHQKELSGIDFILPQLLSPPVITNK